MGKFYARQGRNLYIYVTGGDVMMDLELFPADFGLFGTESAWRIRENMAIVTGAEEEVLDKAEIILSLNAFKRRDTPEELLQAYYVTGKESVLEGEPAPPRAPEPVQPTVIDEGRVIMPPSMGPYGVPLFLPDEEDEKPPEPDLEAEPVRPVEADPPLVDDVIERENEPTEAEPDLPEMMRRELRDFLTGLVHSRHGFMMLERQVQWLRHISRHWEELRPVLEEISEAPLMAGEGAPSEAGRSRGGEKTDAKFLLKKIEGLVRDKGWESADLKDLLATIPLRTTEEVVDAGYDVPENRMIRSHVDDIRTRLGSISDASSRRDRLLRERLKRAEGSETIGVAREFLANSELHGAVNGLLGEVDGLLGEDRFAFLSQVGGGEGPPETRATGSRAAYSRLLKLTKGYKESAPPQIMGPSLPPLESLEPQELYSMWCFVKLMDAAKAAGLQLKGENITSTGENEVLVRVTEGSEVTFSFDGATVRIIKEKRYGNEPPYGSYTTPKRASLAIEAFRDGATPRIIFLEPRYDVNYTRETLEGGDLDRLQVLRDSIVDLSSETRERLASGCYVVHPTVAEPLAYDGLGSMTMRPREPLDRLTELLKRLSG
jgi:hypothetical protein